ncbi:MAG: cob(I)yrinic acid a,c-diamide adenosyltransferase [Candidatus Blackburnbacteria bacterium]|nr:cob(I)yrinic acid a,c-diamide adenosyltransferase [Candidatus Blackburnbacteria bacterium]
MAIYTKRGDRGTTTLYGEKRRRSKSNERISAYGTVDELNSQLGLASSLLSPRTRRLKVPIRGIQQDLFEIAAELATPPPRKPAVAIKSDRARKLEKLIDDLEGRLPVLANFIFPGGSSAGAAMHVARSICRRAERVIVKLAKKEKVRAEILVYLNRLSDTLFMLAREINHLDKKPEEKWRGDR